MIADGLFIDFLVFSLTTSQNDSIYDCGGLHSVRVINCQSLKAYANQFAI